MERVVRLNNQFGHLSTDQFKVTSCGMAITFEHPFCPTKDKALQIMKALFV